MNDHQVIASKGIVTPEPWTVRKSEKYEGRYFFFNKETKESVWVLNKKDLLLIDENSHRKKDNEEEETKLPSYVCSSRRKRQR
mmetsp:Transcript_50524/g.64741  ORF Transcript_50524/g.64741 Transcript_50524/m.64741 type:complete len:83 (-) Transcript_50524:481-729(-)